MADQNLRILLVEDEQTLSETIKLNLEMEGYYVNAVGDGKTAIKVFKEARYNLVILDVMLPEISGFTVCEAIRLENLDVPILFLSAKNHPNDRITGLKLGGDDYLTKPFNLEELLLRVHNLIKRSTASKEVVALSTYNLNNNQINFAQLEIKRPDGTITHLTKKESLLLKLLIEKRNEVVSREHILETVWGYDIYPSTRTIDNFIVTFRKYFEPDPSNPKYFISVRGVGYKFTDQV
ncbi:MAG: response regulator transcription factor [Bacteroidetes bacterium]|jgi:two-component system alkaline phosphatase synthesis response regulator PhoP|nr:response regulator transcription factor [Bacteroidota bacterium]MBX7239313.1 response regulator transcription factor [Bacteroidia bacterium]MCC7513597.1 response regulator transcription factor [Bacteroidia bacterium]MCW5918477.1 response regulator transcription factor [Bacteroidota bacterium]HMU77422.1 response regulator transcription factor [Bacteroidia bacterium]